MSEAHCVGCQRDARGSRGPQLFVNNGKIDIRLLGKGNSNPMAQVRSTKIISMIKWIRTSSLLIKISLLCE